MKPYKVCTVLWRFTLRRPLILSNSTFMNTFSKTIFSRPASFTSNWNPSLKKENKNIASSRTFNTHIYYKNTDQLKQNDYSWTQNLFATVTLGTEESGRCGEMTVVERFKRQSMYGLSAKKVHVEERWALVEFRLFNKFVSMYEAREQTVHSQDES